ncbi:MAG: CPBP family intramembrane glutamic endopeptidase [Christensenellales bacterium]|jgi:membrane protease YdiL (CAAX protease family)
MQLFASELISSAVQILLFSAIPFIWWLISARRKEGFLSWIGLKRPVPLKGFTLVFVLTILAFSGLSAMVLLMMHGIETAASQFAGMGLSVLPTALIYAFLTTALSEEILFRGFLLKRLSGRFGFTAGNIAQSALFGLLHGVMFCGVAGPLKAAIITVFTGSIGWCLGHINERKAGGSIIPGWAIHGAANLISSLAAMFSIFQ